MGNIQPALACCCSSRDSEWAAQVYEKPIRLDKRIHVAIVGDMGVGKTSLVECFLTGEN